MERIIFYILAVIILGFALLSVNNRKILRSAVYLFFVLIGIAGLYFLFGYNFLGAVQLTIYAGGIVVLIIFSILLTHHIDYKLEVPPVSRFLLAGGIAIAGAVMTSMVILGENFETIAVMEPQTMESIGRSLLSFGKNGYLLPFEVLSILLLAAMVGAIYIARKKNPKTDKNLNKS